MTINPRYDHRLVQLKYVETVRMQTLTSAPAKYVFSANNIYDPNVTGTGHQPLFHDQYAAMYDHYLVLGSKIRAQFYVNSNSVTYAGAVGIKIDDNANTTSLVETLLEHNSRNISYRMMYCRTDSSPSMAVVKQYYSPRRFFGFRNPRDARDSIGAACGASPTEQCYYNLFVGTPDNSEDLAEIGVTVTILYMVLFTEPKDQGGS